MLNERLANINGVFSHEKVTLLGIPSYEYLIKSDELANMDDMVIYERLLKESIKGRKLTEVITVKGL